MNMRTIAKGLLGTITSMGVSMVVDKLIEANLPEEEEIQEKAKWVAVANIILITTGKVMISGMISNAAVTYTNDMVDGFADMVLKIRKVNV